MEYLEGLNEAQKRAVCATDGPVLVLAGAGSGKTRTIAHRIVHLVKSGVAPQHILAVTFTNKAAREMRERVLHLLSAYTDTRHREPTVSTFHALSALLLRTYADTAQLKRSFTIFDRNDSLRAVKHALRDIGEDEKRFEPRVILSAISRAKGDAVTLASYSDRYRNAWYQGVVARAWERYDAALRKESALDFDDLLLKLWQLLDTNPTVREELHARWHYLHVDEYQDTNKVQYHIARLLAGPRENIFCTGDLDQNVYSWRGATVQNILGFERDYPAAAVLKLEENYRSTKTIVTVSNRIIEKNVHRKDKTSFTNNPDGDPMVLISAFNERHEAELVTGTIQELASSGTSWSDIAILYRANFQSRALEDACLAANIPYRVLGTRFFDRKEVKDTLSYLRAALNPDSESDIRRIINEPARGIGKITVDRYFAGGREALPAAAQRKVDDFFVILKDIRDRVHGLPAHEAVAYTIERSGVAASLGSGGDEAAERLENVRELASLAATRYNTYDAPEGILRLLEDAALATDQDELDQRTAQGDVVTLMTVHAAKGLEFSCVFITGMEDGLFPHERMAGPHESAVDDEEERRLFYVALTRAKTRVWLSYAQARTVFGRTTDRIPSSFLLDIDEEFLEPLHGPLPKKGKVIYLD